MLAWASARARGLEPRPVPRLQEAETPCIPQARCSRPGKPSNEPYYPPQTPIFWRDSIRALETLSPFAGDPPAPSDERHDITYERHSKPDQEQAEPMLARHPTKPHPRLTLFAEAPQSCEIGVKSDARRRRSPRKGKRESSAVRQEVIATAMGLARIE